MSAHKRWLGGFKTSSSWEWVTGEEFTHTNWFLGEPNNLTGNENYLQFTPNNQLGQWNDNSNGGHLSGIDVRYIIEFQPVPIPTALPLFLSAITIMGFVSNKSKKV